MFHNSRISTDNECCSGHAEEELDRFEVLDDALRSAPIQIVNKNDQLLDIAVLEHFLKPLAEGPDVDTIFVFFRFEPGTVFALFLGFLFIFRF